MANPLAFKPIHVDPRVELQRRLEAAPIEHGEALLVAWDLLETAHKQGVLDLLHGVVGARDTIFGKLTEYAKLPEGVAGIRNMISILKIMTELDPDTLSEIAKSMGQAVAEHQKETKPASLWAIAKRATSEDSRRGLSLMTLMLTSLGRSLKR